MNRKTVACLALTLVIMGTTVYPQDYDLVINHGRVMDPETMYDDVANVGIKDGRIAIITKDKITGKETINARGLVVAPGFIDTHLHAVDRFATKMVVADGVTTGMDLEAGAVDSLPGRGARALPARRGQQVDRRTPNKCTRYA